MKAAAEKIMPQVKGGYNIVFVPRRKSQYDFWQLQESMQKLLEKAELLQ